MHNESQENPWRPAHVSDRADELRAELDEEQLGLLFRELQTMSYAEWLAWIEAKRAAICRYDYSSPAERRRQLRKPGGIEVLMLHHACAWLELWRARTAQRFFPLPPAGAPLDSPERHREMLLACLASLHDLDERDQWPFDLPEGEDQYPFRE